MRRRRVDRKLVSLIAGGIATALLLLPAAGAVTSPATLRVSVGAHVEGNGFTGSPAISGDGRLVAFQSSATNLVPGDTNVAGDVFVYDRSCGTTTRASLGPSGAQATGGSSSGPSLSGDGRFVAFSSVATNLVAGDTNVVEDVFVRDRQLAATTRASVDTSGVQANGASIRPALGDDGSAVIFDSVATNLVAGDTNAQTDVFVRTARIQPRRSVPSCGP